MSIDFTRSASDKITAASVPLGSRPFVMECWFQIDPWGVSEVTYGALMGIYSSNYKVMLRVEKDLTGFPATHKLQFVVKNVTGTFTAEATLSYAAGQWYHGLGLWRVGTPGQIYVLLDGVVGSTSASTGLIIGLNEYAFGYDKESGGDHFDGRMAEWATWSINPTSSAGYVRTACKGWNPIDRDPFFAAEPTPLTSWVQGHNTSVFDIMRPSVSYTETGVSTDEDHPPVFEAPHCEPYPRPPLVLPTRRIGVGGYFGTDPRKLLAG